MPRPQVAPDDRADCEKLPAFAKKKAWEELTDDEVKDLVRRIIQTAKSDDEIRRRVEDELGCPAYIAGSMAINAMRLPPFSPMVSVMFYGPRGNTLQTSS